MTLDALIPRDDFESIESQPISERKESVSITDLQQKEFFFSVLKKPDFQRETSEWDANKIAEFVETFLDGDLIPAVILWQSPGSNIFVIDGGHRLSSIIAWINNDYGDGPISKAFYDNGIPVEQFAVANRARKVIHGLVGSYQDHRNLEARSGPANPKLEERARRLGALGIKLQWVPGSAKNAEESFRKINQKASPINQTEMRVLEARHKPLGIAARAIVRGGKGHKYWRQFTVEVQSQLERLAVDIHNLLFQPKLPQGSIKTLDLPMGGHAYAAASLPLVLEFISFVNGPKALQEDISGEATLECLKRCKRVAETIDSNYVGSLGMHPAVYFYSDTGRHKVASFWATTLLIIHLNQNKQFPKYTRVRVQLEDLLLKYDYLIQQIVRNRRGGVASAGPVKDFFVECIRLLDSGKTVTDVIDLIVDGGKFGKLSTVSPETVAASREFSKQTKSQVFIRSALESALRCAICGGYLHVSGMSVDHKQRKEDGGLGAVDNGQMAHPYCNSGYKESVTAETTARS